jgi:hypothetical protein
MVFNNDININSVTKKNIDNTLLMLGRELILPNESLIFYHSSPQKFKNINNIGNWFSPIKIKEKENYYRNNNIFTHDKPLWDNGYDFRFINKKPVKLLSIHTYTNDITSYKLKTMIDIVNYNIAFQEEDLEEDLENTALQKSRVKTVFEKSDTEDVQDSEDRHFLLGQETDPEYLLAYYLCKYSSFDGWITNASYLGFCMLKKECLKKLNLLSVTEPPNSNDNDNITMYYTYKQWNEQFM